MVGCDAEACQKKGRVRKVPRELLGYVVPPKFGVSCSERKEVSLGGLPLTCHVSERTVRAHVR